jgi:hypothetical protein
MSQQGTFPTGASPYSAIGVTFSSRKPTLSAINVGLSSIEVTSPDEQGPSPGFERPSSGVERLSSVERRSLSRRKKTFARGKRSSFSGKTGVYSKRSNVYWDISDFCRGDGLRRVKTRRPRYRRAGRAAQPKRSIRSRDSRARTGLLRTSPSGSARIDPTSNAEYAA